MILFSVFFAGLPYYIYYYLLSHREIDFVLRYSFLLIFMTLVGQAFLMRNVTQAVFVSGMIVAMGAALPLVVRQQNTRRKKE